MKLIKIILSSVSLLIIGIYKYLISPFTPASCRHYPTCSSYASEAVKKHGFIEGSLLSIKRLGKCHPWGTEGYDPVPDYHFKVFKKGKTEPFNLHKSLQKKDFELDF